MADEKNQFTGVLTDAEDGEIILVEESPSDGLLISKGKNKIAIWPDQLAAIVKAFRAWQS